jgi:hypothetical protein
VKVLLEGLDGLIEGVVQEVEVMVRARFEMEQIRIRDFEAEGTDYVV